jgi:DNA-binding HxlR family transcriptional regulator
VLVVPELEEEVRAGSRVLSLFANPLNFRVLRAYSEGPKRLSEVRELVGWPADSTLRTVNANLCEVGAIARVEQPGQIRGAMTALSPAGEELLAVADALQAWLARFPDHPIGLDSEEAKGAVKALAGGWSSALIRELATRPTTLGDLNASLLDITYPALERRLDWMRMTGQIEAVSAEGRGVPYRPTEWLRRAIAPLCAAGRCERRLPAFEAPPVTNLEVEAALLLFLPLASLPDHAIGECLLAVQTDPIPGDSEGPTYAGVAVSVAAGEIVAAIPEVRAEPPNWVVSTVAGWLDAVLDGRLDELRLGGANDQLALDLIAGLHMGLADDRGNRNGGLVS